MVNLDKIIDLISDIRDQIEEAEWSISCARNEAREILDYCESADREMVLARKKLDELDSFLAQEDIDDVKASIWV